MGPSGARQHGNSRRHVSNISKLGSCQFLDIAHICVYRYGTGPTEICSKETGHLDFACSGENLHLASAISMASPPGAIAMCPCRCALLPVITERYVHICPDEFWSDTQLDTNFTFNTCCIGPNTRTIQSTRIWKSKKNSVNHISEERGKLKATFDSTEMAPKANVKF